MARPGWAEKDLEDWLMEEGRLQSMLEDHYMEYDPRSKIFRQVHCPVGIMDIVVFSRDIVLVIELKAETAGPDALCQLLAYLSYVRWRHCNLAKRLDGGRAVHDNISELSEPYATRGLLIAPSFTDTTVRAATECLEGANYSNGVSLASVHQSFRFDYPPPLPEFNEPHRQDVMDDQFDICWAMGAESSLDEE